MARGTPVVLSTRTFSTKKDAVTFFKNMLGRYSPNERVSEADSIELRALLEKHTEKDAKIGCGISHFEVIEADFNTHCFCVVRLDGSMDDFSYRHCISPKKD